MMKLNQRIDPKQATSKVHRFQLAS
jgi:hypothetical protein